MAIRKINSVSEGPKRGQEDKKRTRRWGNIFLFEETLTLPKDVTQVGNIYLEAASLTLPEGVTQVGNISLIAASLTLPEGVTKVGLIDLFHHTFLALPEGVTSVLDIRLHDFTSLTLPKGLTQVRGLCALSGGCSITFPDGYILKNSGHGILEYSAKEMNQLLSAHQEFLEKEKDPEGLQGQRVFVVYPEDVSEGRPLPMSVEGRLTNDGKAYVSFSNGNRIIPEDGLIMVKYHSCNFYDAFERKTFDLLYQMNPDGSASRKKQSETMKPEIRKKSLLKK